jgi:Alw26I/Eco31I/Esp3I family type II restriction m6 adenine DNA methyltransferase
MEHVSLLRSIEHPDTGNKGLLIRTTGHFYTHPTIGRYLARALWTELVPGLQNSETVSLLDPFAGDGRLALWLLECALAAGRVDLSWNITLWDLDGAGLEIAKSQFSELRRQHRTVRIELATRTQDTFREALNHADRYDVVVTNPPWDLLKPDRRELSILDERARAAYISSLRRYEEILRRQYPLSRPTRRFAGWGTQLSRVGVEVCLRLIKPGGTIGLVTPSSLLADDSTVTLRRRLIAGLSLKEVGFFPAEAKLFGAADIASATLLLRAIEPGAIRPILRRFDSSGKSASIRVLSLDSLKLEQNGYSIPIAFGGNLAGFEKIAGSLPTFRDLETRGDFWAGRELDETNITTKLAENGLGLFIKGRMIQRLSVTEEPTAFVREDAIRRPPSIAYPRIAWRDVSRPNQKRRLIATLIPSGWIAGNSLGIAYFRDKDDFRLRVLLGLMLSFPFEYQLRGVLSTGHVSLSALRKVRIPEIRRAPAVRRIANCVDQALRGRPGAEARLEAAVALAYGLTESDLCGIIDSFPKVTRSERDIALSEYRRLVAAKV